MFIIHYKNFTFNDWKKRFAFRFMEQRKNLKVEVFKSRSNFDTIFQYNLISKKNF